MGYVINFVLGALSRVLLITFTTMNDGLVKEQEQRLLYFAFDLCFNHLYYAHLIVAMWVL